MSVYKPTLDEWMSYVSKTIQSPFSPKSISLDAASLYETLETPVAKPETTITVAESWEGIFPLDEEQVQSEVLYRAGRWFVYSSGICNTFGSYYIELSDCLKNDWVTHMMRKTWLYDPTDFFDVLEFARQLREPDKGFEWLDELVWQDVHSMFKEWIRPVFPSRMYGVLYQVDRMTDEERKAFCSFLVGKGLSD